MVIGYTIGVYDLFRVVSLNPRKNPKSRGDKLAVWDVVDKLVQYKDF